MGVCQGCSDCSVEDLGFLGFTVPALRASGFGCMKLRRPGFEVEGGRLKPWHAEHSDGASCEITERDH